MSKDEISNDIWDRLKATTVGRTDAIDDLRTNQLWGAIQYAIGRDRAANISKVWDHKGDLSIYQYGLTPKEMQIIADLWEFIGGEPPDNVRFFCHCCRECCSSHSHYYSNRNW